MTMPRAYALVGLLLLLLLLAFFLFRPTTRALATYHVSQADGDDSRACSQATSANAPRRSINGGVACLKGGDVLLIGAGTYDELLITQTSSSTTCHSGDVAVQPNCVPIPNGLSASQPTKLVANGAILSPRGRQWPGGGAAINAMDYARFVHIEGLRIVKNAASGSTGGIYIGNAQHITVKNNTLDNGQIKAGVTSRYVQVIGNEIFDTGTDRCPVGVKPTPKDCAHGMYLCGTDHIVSDNYVHDTSYYGIQVSCESGGIARIKLERNRVENNPGVGIRCAGTDCLIAANVLRGNGQAITTTGSGVVSGNSIDGYYRADWNPDPTGIWSTWGNGSGFQITNNIFTNQKNAFLTIGSVENTPPDPAKAHHNMCEASGNQGCTLIAPKQEIYAPSADGPLKPGSPAIKAGVPQAQVQVDIRGTPYPSPPDLGAYSSQGTAPPQDTTAPTVRITNPPPNEQVFGPSLPLAASASDNVGVVRVVFQIDGATVGEQTSPPYQVSWDTTTVGNGTHRAVAIATDAAGNSTTSPVITLVVDNPLPPEPAPGQPVLACSGTITGGTALAFTCAKPQEVRR